MGCLHCGKRLALLRRLSDKEFCTQSHRNAYHLEQQRLAVNRLLEAHLPPAKAVFDAHEPVLVPDPPQLPPWRHEEPRDEPYEPAQASHDLKFLNLEPMSKPAGLRPSSGPEVIASTFSCLLPETINHAKRSARADSFYLQIQFQTLALAASQAVRCTPAAVPLRVAGAMILPGAARIPDGSRGCTAPSFGSILPACPPPRLGMHFPVQNSFPAIVEYSLSTTIARGKFQSNRTAAWIPPEPSMDESRASHGALFLSSSESIQPSGSLSKVEPAVYDLSPIKPQPRRRTKWLAGELARAGGTPLPFPKPGCPGIEAAPLTSVALKFDGRISAVVSPLRNEEISRRIGLLHGQLPMHELAPRAKNGTGEAWRSNELARSVPFNSQASQFETRFHFTPRLPGCEEIACGQVPLDLTTYRRRSPSVPVTSVIFPCEEFPARLQVPNFDPVRLPTRGLCANLSGKTGLENILGSARPARPPQLDNVGSSLWGRTLLFGQSRLTAIEPPLFTHHNRSFRDEEDQLRSSLSSKFQPVPFPSRWKAFAGRKWITLGLPVVVILVFHATIQMRNSMAASKPEASLQTRGDGAGRTPKLAAGGSAAISGQAEKSNQESTVPGTMRGFFAQRILNLKLNLSERAAIDSVDDFRSGLTRWEGRGDWARTWTYDRVGLLRPGQLAIYQPSMGLSDYTLEFNARAERGFVSWVFRARDLNNYYGMRLQVMRAGSTTQGSLEHWLVLGGREQSRRYVPTRTPVSEGTITHVKVAVVGSSFTTTVNGQIADTWTDTRIDWGGVGFFNDKGGDARIHRVSVSHQNDFIGKLCAFFKPHASTGRELR